MPMATGGRQHRRDSRHRHADQGVVKADQPPIVTLDEDAIAAYGVSSIQELLSVLAPQTGSGAGAAATGR
jgi:hypothetical protein